MARTRRADLILNQSQIKNLLRPTGRELDTQRRKVFSRQDAELIKAAVLAKNPQVVTSKHTFDIDYLRDGAFRLKPTEGFTPCGVWTLDKLENS